MNNDSDFQLPSSTESNVKLGFYIAIPIIGFFGNGLFVMVIASKKKLSIPDRFILNLGISDFCFIVVTIAIFIHSQVNGSYNSLSYCRTAQPLMTVFYFTSIFTITVIAVHHCSLITNPHKPKMSKRSAYIWIASVWISSLVIMLP